MKNKELLRFVMLTTKCFVILIVIGILLPKAVEYVLQSFINNTTIYKNSIFVNKLVDKNFKLAYNYILTFYLFFRA